MRFFDQVTRGRSAGRDHPGCLVGKCGYLLVKFEYSDLACSSFAVLQNRLLFPLLSLMFCVPFSGSSYWENYISNMLKAADCKVYMILFVVGSCLGVLSRYAFSRFSSST